jgi:hypothetical protein
MLGPEIFKYIVHRRVKEQVCVELFTLASFSELNGREISKAEGSECPSPTFLMETCVISDSETLSLTLHFLFSQIMFFSKIKHVK